MRFNPALADLLNGSSSNIEIVGRNHVRVNYDALSTSQMQTKDAFSTKWGMAEYESESFRRSLEHQKNWYLELYGFCHEGELAHYLSKCSMVLDAGAGKCGKAAWFAELSPSTTIVAADISTSLEDAVKYYGHLQNLFFIQCDIARMPFFQNDLFDYVSCDQVIHHTADPYRTFQELVRVARPSGEIACYVYRKKALPRELLDAHFREYCKSLSHEDILALAEQLTELGRVLSSVEEDLTFPGIPLLGITGGTMKLQRFIYWNFLKCFWNEELGHDNSVLVNYDWYCPSQAARYSEAEFRQWIELERLSTVYFHREEACYSGRFLKGG